MSWGLKITNNQGKEICYGAEAIPCCIAAFEHDIKSVSFTSGAAFDTKVLDIPFQSDVVVFFRNVDPKRKIAPIVAASNVGGKLGIQIGMYHDMNRNGTVVSRGRFYVVSRIPHNTKVAGDHGVAMWGSDGQLSFYSGYPPAQIQPLQAMAAGSFPNIGTKRAVIPTTVRGAYLGQDGGSQQMHIYGFFSNIVMNDGSTSEGMSMFQVNPFPPGGSWGKFQPYTLVAMDTADADKKYFND
ncbi:hypothetical protein [Vibrio vulnificus]|uniref:hypothetical protein n=1 Tax=Vibrio vulnificus TaxID=672 RepID=UPI0032420289